MKKAFGNSNEIWIELFRQNANYPLDLLCRGSLNKCKSNNLFIKQLFDIWDNAQLFFKPTTPEQVINECLWQNPNILFNNKQIYLRNWYSAGIRTIGDLWNFETNEIKDKIDLPHINLLTDFQYTKITKAISKYNEILKHAKQNQIINVPYLKSKYSLTPLEKLNTKTFYHLMVENVKGTFVHEARVQSWFNQEVDWKSVYEAPHHITRNAYALQVQFKITHNILPT